MYQTIIDNDLLNRTLGTPRPVPAGYREKSTHHTYSELFRNFELQTRKQMKRTILLMNCNPKIAALFKASFSDSDRYEVLNNMDADLTPETIEALKPHMLLMGIHSLDEECLRKIERVKTNPDTAEIPFAVFSENNLSPDEIDTLLSSGVVDCIHNSADQSTVRLQLKSTLLQVQALNDYRMREESIRQEHSRLSGEYERLQQKIESGQRESLAHLELLMHSKEVNGTIVDKINDLRPYLNVHGKAKLKQLTRQIKWELNDEEELNLERKFDESNFDFYKILEAYCSELTRYEMRLCAYLRSNNSSADIARITRKTANCINVAFARIRLKLGMKHNNELKTFLKGLNSKEPVAVH